MPEQEDSNQASRIDLHQRIVGAAYFDALKTFPNVFTLLEHRRLVALQIRDLAPDTDTTEHIKLMELYNEQIKKLLGL